MLAGIHCKNVEEEKSGIYLHAAYQNVGQILKKNYMLDKTSSELQV